MVELWKKSLKDSIDSTVNQGYPYPDDFFVCVCDQLGQIYQLSWSSKDTRITVIYYLFCHNWSTFGDLVI